MLNLVKVNFHYYLCRRLGGGMEIFMEHYTLPHQHNQPMSQLMDHIPESENFQTTANIFKQLSDPTRIRIFWILCHCEECVINISAMSAAVKRTHRSSPRRQRNLLSRQ